jgi:hypothetical protein
MDFAAGTSGVFFAGDRGLLMATGGGWASEAAKKAVATTK